MKKLFIGSLFIFFASLTAQSQVSPHAIGVRLGASNYGSGGEISYQHGLGDANRLEFDLGWRQNRRSGNDYSRLGITGIYHWCFNITSGLNWFVGPGAQLGFYDDRNGPEDDGLSIGVGAQLGLDYNLEDKGAPLLIGLDIRPMFDFIGYFDGFGYGLALSIRYLF